MTEKLRTGKENTGIPKLTPETLRKRMTEKIDDAFVNQVISLGDQELRELVGSFSSEEVSALIALMHRHQRSNEKLWKRITPKGLSGKLGKMLNALRNVVIPNLQLIQARRLREEERDSRINEVRADVARWVEALPIDNPKPSEVLLALLTPALYYKRWSTGDSSKGASTFFELIAVDNAPVLSEFLSYFPETRSEVDKGIRSFRGPQGVKETISAKLTGLSSAHYLESFDNIMTGVDSKINKTPKRKSK